MNGNVSSWVWAKQMQHSIIPSCLSCLMYRRHYFVQLYKRQALLSFTHFCAGPKEGRWKFRKKRHKQIALGEWHCFGIINCPKVHTIQGNCSFLINEKFVEKQNRLLKHSEICVLWIVQIQDTHMTLFQQTSDLAYCLKLSIHLDNALPISLPSNVLWEQLDFILQMHLLQQSYPLVSVLWYLTKIKPLLSIDLNGNHSS